MAQDTETFADEYRQHLYNQLEKRSKTFTTLFRGTIIFAFAFLAFILIPLVALQHEEYKFNTTIQEQARKKKELAELEKQAGAIEDQLSSLPALLDERRDELSQKENEVDAINQKLEEIQLQIDKNTSQAGKFEQDSRDMAKIKERFERLDKYDTDRNVEKLRASFRKLNRYFNAPSAQPINDPCVSTDLNKFFRCKVKAIIREDLDKYQAVISEADHVLSGYADLQGKKQIDERIQEVMAGLELLMQRYPEFWRSVRDKIFFFDEFKKPMEAVFQEVDRQMQLYVETLNQQNQKIIAEKQRLEMEGDRISKKLSEKTQLQASISEEINALDQEIKKLNVQKNDLTPKLLATQAAVSDLNLDIEQRQDFIDKITAAKTDIEERLEKMQSPFGTLPVGLKEAVLAFPIAVAAGIVLYGFALADMIRLRELYHHATIKRYEDSEPVDQKAISIMVPVWIDPLGSQSANRWRMLMLCLPVLALGITIVLIVYSWLISPVQPGSSPLIRLVYLVLYVLVGVFGSIIAGLRILREWKAYPIP
jgi:DNA repair exonuclease SbcCD ATPase subunit